MFCWTARSNNSNKNDSKFEVFQGFFAPVSNLKIVFFCFVFVHIPIYALCTTQYARHDQYNNHNHCLAWHYFYNNKYFRRFFCFFILFACFFFRLFESNAIITTSECNAGMSVLSAHKYWMINGLLLLFFKFFLWIFFSFARLLASLQFNACRWLSIDILILLYIFMLFFR